jgi:uncharacterized membrane-anchored protein
MKKLTFLLAVLTAMLTAPLLAAPPSPGPATPEQQHAMIESIRGRLHPQTGDVRLPAANVVLHLGANYYYLSASEARIVLVDAWGNPPDAAEGVLGMVFPAGHDFADGSWGAAITYDASGYVSDSDAAETDYNALLAQLQGGEAERNQQRAAQGFPAQHLVGWAQQPAYDARTHSVVWAQDFSFADTPVHSLNYDVRLLGRRGVLSLNMITDMSKLAETRTAAQRFSSSVEFASGERYADYQAGTDRVAEYGVAGLIAAGVGAAVIKKAGLLALLLGFGKWIVLGIIGFFGAMWSRIKRLFGGGGDVMETAYEPGPSAAELAAAHAPETTPTTDPPPPGS